MARLRIFLLAALLAQALPSGARPPTPLQLSEYQKQDWQGESGLPENNVRMIAQKLDGSLLLATSSGIASFDGVRFVSLAINDASQAAGIADNEAVNAILPGGNEELWIGTDGRGVLHQTRLGTVNISERFGFFNERIRAFYRDSSGVLWIATQNGVERLAQDHLTRVAGVGMISGDITTCFAEDGDGGMFFVTSSGLYHWQNGAAQRYAMPLAATDIPVAAYRDQQRRIWIGTSKHVLQLIPRSNTTHQAPARFEIVVRATVSGPITVLLGDSSGDLWIGTRHEGLWRLTPEGVSRWNTANGLVDNAIRSLFLDDEENLWIGMLTGGLSRWRKGVFAPYGEPEGFPATYSANVLADSRGDLWLGTWGKGLFRSHNGRLSAFSPPQMPISTPIRTLAEDRNGKIWVGTWFDGIYKYDGVSFHHYLLGTESPGNAVSVILPDRSGGLWVGTYTGLFHFPSGEPGQGVRSQLLESQLITCLVEDRDGSILVGTSTGLYRVRSGTATVVGSLSRAHILSLTLDSGGYVWATTKGGGMAAVGHDVVTALPANMGLPVVSINAAIEDGDGHLWLSTSRGVVRVSLKELHAVVEGRQATLSAVMLDKADGMRSSECGGPSRPASARLPDGTLWFATTRGFVHTTDVAELLGTIAPVAAIEGWTATRDLGTGDITPLGAHARIDLEAGHADVLLFFSAKLLSNPAHLEFRYRLVGYDVAWTVTRTRVARYRRLPPGKYRFEVQARGSGEEWRSAVASISIEQHPYFYQTWYFYLVVVAVLVVLILYLFQLRVKRMKGRIGIILEERNRIARECHDSLMAGFAAVSWQLEATAKLFRDTQSESTPPAASCELARRMVAHCQAEARRIIWDLRDSDEVTNILSHALRRVLSAALIPEAIEISLVVEGEEMPLAPGCVHHLVCIGQEAVANAVHHAHAGQIAVRLEYESDALNLIVSDDGCGFHNMAQFPAPGGHFGISVMEERARKLGGTLRLQSSVGEGTVVTVRVEFNTMRQSASEEGQSMRGAKR